MSGLPCFDACLQRATGPEAAVPHISDLYQQVDEHTWDSHGL